MVVSVPSTCPDWYEGDVLYALDASFTGGRAAVRFVAHVPQGFMRPAVFVLPCTHRQTDSRVCLDANGSASLLKHTLREHLVLAWSACWLLRVGMTRSCFSHLCSDWSSVPVSVQFASRSHIHCAPPMFSIQRANHATNQDLVLVHRFEPV